jgi:ABC-2 type transport system ATP-binding protein
VTAALEATGLSKRYGAGWALRDCSLSIPSGRVTALVGPNGAGKTTLLHLAIGLLDPSAGSVRVLGARARENPDLLGRIGFVAQDVPLYPTFRVRELLELGRRLNPRWESDLASTRLERLGVPFDRHAGKLSGGERAQVALAMALAKRPELLVLDEPVASLDPLARREFLGVVMEESPKRACRSSCPPTSSETSSVSATTSSSSRRRDCRSQGRASDSSSPTG